MKQTRGGTFSENEPRFFVIQSIERFVTWTTILWHVPLMKEAVFVKMNIPESIQSAVDQYVEIYQVSKQLEERMKELKSLILSFMRENEFSEIPDSNHYGKVQLSVSERATLTARYTTYNLDELAKLLDAATLDRCVVSVVDKDKLAALSKLGEVDDDILEHKSTRPSYALTVRLE